MEEIAEALGFNFCWD